MGLPSAASLPAAAPIAALTQDRALIGLLRGTVDPQNELIIVNSEHELLPQLGSREIAAALLDSMFIEGDLGALAERLRQDYPDLVLVVVGTTEEQTRVAAQITSGVVYRFLHRPVSAPRVRLFVDAALRRHEVESVERTLEQQRPDFSQLEAANEPRRNRAPLIAGAIAVVLAAVGYGLWPRGDAAPVADATTTDEAPNYRQASSQPTPLAAATEASVEPDVDAAPAQAPVAAKTAPAAVAVNTPTPPAVPTKEQRLREVLAQAEAALQRGDLMSPAGGNAAELFTAALAIDATNTVAKAGVVRVADGLLAAAESAVTAGKAEEAKRLLDAAERLSPATTRGAFVKMQIDKERERSALTRAREVTDDRQERGRTYLRLASTRLRSGMLIEPSEDNARFYLEAARAMLPNDPAFAEVEQALSTELLNRARTAANAGNAVDAERWLANAEGAGATSGELASIRRVLNENVLAARAERMDSLTQSFTTALAAGRLIEPAATSAKTFLRALMEADATHPASRDARQNLGNAFLKELRIALARDDFATAERWLGEARAIGLGAAELAAAEGELTSARSALAQRNSIVGANSLQRVEYVEPKFPPITRDRGMSGWVELEFTVGTDGATRNIVVTNSQPRRIFDSAAVAAVGEWRYRPVIRDGSAVEQRARIRIRFAEE